MKQNVVSNFDLIENEWVDPDIRLGVHINSDIRLGGFNMFPSVSRLFLCWREANVFSQTEWGAWPAGPPDLPLKGCT